MKESRQRLSGVHHAEESGVVDELLEAVRRRRRGADVPEAYLLEKREERLIRQRAERTKHRSFIERCDGESSWVELAVADSLVVREEVLRAAVDGRCVLVVRSYVL